MKYIKKPQYGFAVFRATALIDDAHVALARRLLGPELDNVRRYLTAAGPRRLRYDNLELFDASNLDGAGDIVPPDSPRAHYNKGNAMFVSPKFISSPCGSCTHCPPPPFFFPLPFFLSSFFWGGPPFPDLYIHTQHVDSSFNPRRASFSALRAVLIPPPGHGGATEFADSRTAWADLAPAVQDQLLLPTPLVGAHSLNHSRKKGSPAFFAALDVEATVPAMARHRLAQVHEPSGRTNLYVGAHLHHIVGMDRAASDALIKKLNDHATRPQYVTSVSWEAPGDMIIWDNRAVLHRATGGAFESRYKRDMRRATVHDDGTYAWGENRVGETMPGFDSYSKPLADSVGRIPIKE